MSGKKSIFDDKKMSKSNFYESKKIFSIYNIDVDKTFIPKKKIYDKTAHSDTFFDIMVMTSLDFYV